MVQVTNPAEIKINADPSPQGDSCRFILDRPLYEGVVASFGDAGAAVGSPLAEQLFAIQGVTKVVITPGVLTVYRGANEGDWRPLAVQVGKTIRAHAGSGAPAVAEKFKPDPAIDQRLRAGVQELFDREVNPSLASHGGYVRILDVRNYMVFVELGGGCQGCGQANVTLKQGIETMVKQRLPEVVAVVDTTDHAGGANPYYKAGGGHGHH